MFSGSDLARLHDALVILDREGLVEAAAGVRAVLVEYNVPDDYVRFVLDEPDEADIECAAAYIASQVDDPEHGILRYTVEWVPATTPGPVK